MSKHQIVYIKYARIIVSIMIKIIDRKIMKGRREERKGGRWENGRRKGRKKTLIISYRAIRSEVN